MEPEIESITGLERDTETFMKIMRLFNAVSSKQQEVEIAFELKRRTIHLLKLNSSSNEQQRLLSDRYQLIVGRWQNLKSKVMQAKQRLGPTLKEESAVIVRDLRSFQDEIDRLSDQIEQSDVFAHELTFDEAQQILSDFTEQQKQLDKQALDYKQLQSLVDASAVDFSRLSQCRDTLKHLTSTWTTVR
jgi:ribonuclease BN (tRNA processing enzyme)